MPTATRSSDANGRFIKKEIIAHTVMQKERGWGADYPADWPRNGDWEYAAFTADGRPNEKANANNKSCFTCHLLHAKQDFVISLAAERHLPEGRAEPCQSDQGCQGRCQHRFLRLPAGEDHRGGGQAAHLLQLGRHSAPDLGGERPEERSLRGQKASITIDRPGEYNYICGLHPR